MDLFDLLNRRVGRGSSQKPDDVDLLNYARSNNLINDQGNITEDGKTKLDSMNKDRQLLSALQQIKEQVPATTPLTAKQKLQIAKEIATQNNLPVGNLQFFINHPAAADRAILDISQQWVEPKSDEPAAKNPAERPKELND